MTRIGVYGGTFDPVHLGHLILARDAMEQLQLERVLFIPAAQSPHKPGAAFAPGDARLEMLRAATADEPGFAVDDRELRRPAPSYTIDTVLELRSQHPDAEFFYLIGKDQLPGLIRWRKIDLLRELLTFVVLNRGDDEPVAEFQVIARRVEISATQIRNRVATGRSIRYLVPPATEEIIRRRQLYTER